MVAPPFDYVAASSYDEAIAMLTAGGEDAKVLAGGQSLMPMLNLRLARPSLLIDINDADQRRPELHAGKLRLPAMTRHAELIEEPLVREHCPLLSCAVGNIGNTQVRNRGTIGGSLAHADPAAEIGTCALALGAEVIARGPDGERTIQADDLFVTFLTTALEPNEVITDVLIPVIGPREGWAFSETTLRTSDFAIVAAAAWVELAPTEDTVAAARLALAGVSGRVVLVSKELLDCLLGVGSDDPVIDTAAAVIADSVDPGSDFRASADYRRRLVRVLSIWALRRAIHRAARIPEAETRT